MNEVTYTDIRERCGLPYLKVKADAMPQGTVTWASALKPHSELNLLGYNVNATNGLSAMQRKKILTEAIDSGVLSRQKIMNHLELLISMGEKKPHMQNAVEAWHDDHMYVSQYKEKEQRKVWINRFKSRFSEFVLS